MKRMVPAWTLYRVSDIEEQDVEQMSTDVAIPSIGDSASSRKRPTVDETCFLLEVVEEALQRYHRPALDLREEVLPLSRPERRFRACETHTGARRKLERNDAALLRGLPKAPRDHVRL